MIDMYAIIYNNIIYILNNHIIYNLDI
jgi:hypothetical protein